MFDGPNGACIRPQIVGSMLQCFTLLAYYAQNYIIFQEKAKLKRAKERARQRALLKKQQQLQSPFQQQQLQTQDENTSPSIENSITKMQSTSTPVGTIPFTLQQLERG